MREIPPPVFSRRSFLFFIVLAPACLLAVAGIVLTLQYRQFRTMVSPTSTVPFTVSSTTAGKPAELLASLAAFSKGAGPDTLTLSPSDLNELTAASTVLQREQIRFRLSAGPATAPGSGTPETLLIVESSRKVDALNGKLAWIFKRIAPIPDGWLNARMEGVPEFKAGQLAFAPERGFIKDTKVPRAAMTKRGGMSPKDFLEPAAAPEYAAFIAALDTVYWNGRAVVLVRKAKSEN